MGRRKEDRTEQVIRVVQGNHSAFVASVLGRIKLTPLPNDGLILPDGEADYDENGHGTYTGLYYDLRELCDDLALQWPGDAEIITRWVHSVKIVKQPQAKYWKWFRMADSGLGLPTPAERKSAHYRGKITAEAIAEIEGVKDARTVQRAIKQCWDYILTYRADLIMVARLVDLHDSHFLDAIRAIEKKREKLRQNRD